MDHPQKQNCINDNPCHLTGDFYESFLSKQARERVFNSIWRLAPLERSPGVISLLAGKPNPEMFPMTALSFKLRCPLDDVGTEKLIELDQQSLSESLQYTSISGVPALINWLFDLQKIRHGRVRCEGWRISVGHGSQDLLYKTLHCLLDPGDAVLLESPSYTGVIPILQSLHCDISEVATDSEGVYPQSLRQILESWPTEKPKPKILYTVPHGCNPTGTSTSAERRREILELSKMHDFIILEDDPYCHLYYGDDPQAPSYFALERTSGGPTGRVVRFDSLSKIISAGMRVGFVSGPAKILDAIDSHTSNSSLAPGSFAQIIAYKMLESWSYEGLEAHTRAVSAIYRRKRNLFNDCLKKHLSGLAEWNLPQAGMFFWIKLHLGRSENEGDSEMTMEQLGLECGILAVPGAAFLTSSERTTSFVRCSFGLLPEHDYEEAAKRLRDLVISARRLGSKENT
ncbi:PLP-dependent transferase [Mycena floridula]|nr:PLP-dependent transferase [Mycena floridula]